MEVQGALISVEQVRDYYRDLLENYSKHLRLALKDHRVPLGRGEEIVKILAGIIAWQRHGARFGTTPMLMLLEPGWRHEISMGAKSTLMTRIHKLGNFRVLVVHREERFEEKDVPGKTGYAFMLTPEFSRKVRALLTKGHTCVYELDSRACLPDVTMEAACECGSKVKVRVR